jgi:capsular exopolysaccharide synthesis family protein
MSNQTPSLTPTTSPTAGEAPISKYLRVVRKRIWLIGAVVALGVTAVVFYTLSRPKVYEAIARVEIDPQPPQVFGREFQDVITLGTQSSWQNEEYYNTQLEIVRGYTLAEQTVITNRLWENPKLVDPSQNSGKTRDELIAVATALFIPSLSATRNPESRIVNIHVRHTDPDLAIELANKHVESFLAYTRSLRTEGSGRVATSLATELDMAAAQLKKTEEALLKFKKENDILSMTLEDKESILAKDIGRLSDAATEARVKRMELASLRDRLKQVANEEILQSPLFGLTGTLTSNATLVGILKDQYFRERESLVSLEESLGPKHPSYVAQKKKVQEILSSIKNEAALAVRELEEKYSTLAANEKVFTAELNRLKQTTFELAPKSLEYSRLVRQQEADAANYTLVLGRLRSSELSSRNTEINVRSHDIARTTTMVYPRITVNVALGVMASVILGIALAFFLEFLDRSLKNAEDVEEAVHAPFLGVIPVVEQVSRDATPEMMRERDLYVFRHPTSRVAECCRSIRTNILFSSADRRMKTIAISSPRPREGKTTSTIYLGSIMVQSGQRVLLVDTDLRRPRLHKSLGVSRSIGVTNIIMGDAEIDDAIKTTDIPNLYLLPCGPQPPNPAELLLTKRFSEVLRQLEERFDFILLDSPPILAVTDAVILSRLSDGVLLIAQAGKTAAEDARRAASQLRDVEAPILGVILNDMDLSDKKYGYYYYQYGYGDRLPDPANPDQASEQPTS